MLKKKFKLPISLFPISAKTIVKDELFTIKSAPNGLGFNRVGVTFKSKSFKTAVLRNKLKRIVFDFFRKSEMFQTRAKDNIQSYFRHGEGNEEAYQGSGTPTSSRGSITTKSSDSAFASDLLIVVNPNIIKLTKDETVAALETITKKIQA